MRESDHSEPVLAEIDGPIGILRLNRPKARNALSDALVGALDEALRRFEADSKVRVILLIGAGGDFAAGADLREMLSMSAGEALQRNFCGCSDRLASVSKPIVAAVGGYALGGGCELVEMCDVVIAAESARFGHPESTVGTMPGAGGTQRLPRAVGKHMALDMLLTGRQLTAAEALQFGLASRVVADEALFDESIAVARKIASLSAPVVRLVKEAVRNGLSGEHSTGLAQERRLFQLAFTLEDRREGMQAFIDRRQPVFTDR